MALKKKLLYFQTNFEKYLTSFVYILSRKYRYLILLIYDLDDHKYIDSLISFASIQTDCIHKIDLNNESYNSSALSLDTGGSDLVNSLKDLA